MFDEWATRMIRFTSGDLLQSEADALVNAVNCAGVMGRGISLQFKKQFPGNFEDYKSACDRGEVVPGKNVHYRAECAEPAKIHREFPDETSLEGQKQDRRY